MESYSYRGMVFYKSSVIQDFYASNIPSAIAMFSHLTEEEYPNTHGQIIDTSSNKIIYQFKNQVDF